MIKNLKKIRLCLLGFIFLAHLISFDSYASPQPKAFWIIFKNKNVSSFDPIKYFTPQALERRISNGLKPFDECDLPVNQEYIELIKPYCIEYVGVSRWLNAVLIQCDDLDRGILESLDFVRSVEPVMTEGAVLARHKRSYSDENLNLLEKQLSLHESGTLIKRKITGKGIRIAVFDGGFPGVDTHPAFKHLIDNNKIVSTWDFTSNKPDVYRFNKHGTAVLSCITGFSDEGPAGMATGAEFLLARTEIAGEPWKEELYWIQAAEWADKMGAHIISSSLGYTYQRYFVRELTGEDTPVARAATIAAGKGILVINCIGNEGDNDWKYAVTPADADSVLSVGGVDPDTHYHISFSSFGPNMKGKMKPNVVASGKVLAATRKSWKTAYGTSFSAPVITGFAACAWQLNPDLTNMEIFKLIEESAHLYPYFDYAHGYGIPKASNLLSNQRSRDNEEEFNIRIEKGKINIKPKIGFTLNPDSHNYLYYKLEGANAEIIRYGIFKIVSHDPVVIPFSETEGISSCTIRSKNSFQKIHL